MSGGQILGGVVGAVAGYFIPGGGAAMALRGMSLGMSIGGYLDPPKGPVVQGPRLEDLTVQSATYGSIIPRVYGTVAVTGNIFWIENNSLKEVETRSSSGGKGGGGGETETVSYLYYASFALGLCKGPISGVRRIWISGKLIYDAGSSDPGTIEASNSAQAGFTIYKGTDSQLPDPRMQSTLGVANTPAYRGLSYIVFSDLALKPYNNSLQCAQIKVEVIVGGGLGATETVIPPGWWNSVAWNGSVFCAIRYGWRECIVSPDGINWTTYPLPTKLTAGFDICWNGSIFCVIAGSGNVAATSPDGINWTSQTLPASALWRSIVWNGTIFCVVGQYPTTGAPTLTSEDGITWDAHSIEDFSINTQGLSMDWNGSVFCVMTSYGDSATSPDGIVWTSSNHGINYLANLASNGSIFCALSDSEDIVAVSSDGLNWTSYPITISANWGGICWGGGTFFAVSYDIEMSGDYMSTVAATSTNGIDWSPLEMPQATDWITAGYGNGRFVALNQSGEIGAVVRLGNGVPLADILNAECISTGLLSTADIDSTEMTKTVRGYRIASVSAIKSSLIQLQGAYPFDVIQSGYKMKFKPRGGESVVIIPASDLGAVGESI